MEEAPPVALVSSRGVHGRKSVNGGRGGRLAEPPRSIFVAIPSLTLALATFAGFSTHQVAAMAASIASVGKAVVSRPAHARRTSARASRAAVAPRAALESQRYATPFDGYK